MGEKYMCDVFFLLLPSGAVAYAVVCIVYQMRPRRFKVVRVPMELNAPQAG